MLKQWLVLWLGLLLVGCNTISGVGKDIEAGGEKVQQAAESTQEKL